MVRKGKTKIDRTLDKLSLNKEAPKSAFILLVMLYFIATFFTAYAARTQGVLTIGDIPIAYASLTGVFSMLGNICIICLVMLFRKVGYFVSLAMLLFQFPMLVINTFVRHNYAGIPGFFTNVLIIVAITIIFFANRKITRYQQSIRDQAVTDRLTGLPNRFACGELMQDYIKHNERFTVVSVDLNNFKSINDTMGHHAGDKVLKEIADRWMNLADSAKTGTVDFVARISGDEYLLIISEYGSETALEDSLNAYKAELEKKITIDDCDYYMTACFGYAQYPEHSDEYNTLFAYADSALHEVKKSGSGSRVLKFSQDLLHAEKTLEIERKIRTALNNNTIFFHLQPQYDMNHKLRGFEALARMKDDDGSFISPVDFIPVAEKTGLIDRIDLRVFDLAAGFLNDISGADSDLMLSVNVSVRHLMKNNFIEEMKKVLETHNIAPERIEVEITESIMIDSAEKALQRIDEIKQMGMKVAIDDFGTGYSSLSYLNSFPSDMLKIDKSFIDQMNLSDSSKQYVAMIISIGHVLDLKVISEGVESADQVEVLKKIGCDYIQGYVWGRPVPPEEASALVKAEK
ncbi:putative bifunctional diguanylate cyclase/phosphodiesterase [Butyrivibrio sp. AE2032]|uniref:putative bifunctional diguanylate cyclase/phosphodiesterase n=1 Tax=Butyrivibrio sp. AE2032 TaxID=1458463 RepID=UPI000552B1DF|nr:GGDEF domain-containing phosphodiesterase [Butyrivibrio sp. AE2032]